MASALLVTALALGASPAWADDESRADVGDSPEEDWQVTLGAGALIAPAYEGADEFEVYPIPLVSVTWKDRIFLDVEHGLGFYALSSDNLRVGFSVGYARGRDEDDANRLRGMGDIDASVRAHAFADASFGPLDLGLDVARDLGGSDGLQVRPSVSAEFALTDTVWISPELSVTWADEQYTRAYFGVTPLQSARSGLPIHEANAGLTRSDFRINVAWRVNDRWFANANLGVGYMLGEAENSPLVEGELQPQFGIFLGRRF